MASLQEQYKTKGNDAFKAKNYTDAITWYTKAIDVDPNCEAAAALYSNRAASYAGMGNHAEAVKDGDQCIRVKPAWLKGHYRKGASLEALNRLDDSLKAFEDALRTEPHNEEVQDKVNSLRARIRERNEKTKPAACKTPEEAKVIGNSLFSQGKYEQAQQFYSRAIELSVKANTTDEEKASFYANRAACRQQIHDYKGVIDDANAALAVVPNHVKALLRRAIAYEGLEKWQLALDDFNAVNRLSPGMSNVAQGIMRCQRSLR
jgi:stress-induced-phosphoprotein 1